MEVNLWTLQFARACVVLSHGEFFPLTSREAKTPKQGFDRKKKKHASNMFHVMHVPDQDLSSEFISCLSTGFPHFLGLCILESV